MTEKKMKDGLKIAITKKEAIHGADNWKFLPEHLKREVLSNSSELNDAERVRLLSQK